LSFYSQFADSYEAIFPFRQAVYSFLAVHLKQSRSRIVDIGCGTGHYCGRFAEEGFDAQGIDLDPAMIKSAGKGYPRASFQCLDMSHIASLNEYFDLAFSIGNVVSHLDKNNLRRFLNGLARVLNSGSVWIFQVVNWDYLLNLKSYHFPPKSIREGRLVFQREYRGISEAGARFLTRLLSDEETLFDSEIPLHPIRTADYLELHREVDFRLLDHYADFARTPFDPSLASGSVFVFRKGSPG